MVTPIVQFKSIAYLKVVVAIDSVKASAGHAAALETGVQSHMGTGHCDRAFRLALCRHEQSCHHALHEFPKRSLVCVCWTVQK